MKLVRILSTLVALCATSLVFAPGQAAATQFREYAASGTSFNGAGSVKGLLPVGSNLVSLAYDDNNEWLYVLVRKDSGEGPGYVQRFTKAGASAPFSALGRDWIGIGGENFPLVSNISDITVDVSGGSDSGNVYIYTGGFGGSPRYYGFKPDGTPLSEFEPEKEFYEEFTGGIGADPTIGGIWAARDASLRHYTADREITANVFAGFNPVDPEHVAVDTGGNFYVRDNDSDRLKKLPPDPVQEDVGPPEREELYEVSQATNVNGYAIDLANDDLYLATGFNPTTVTHYDSAGTELTSFVAAEGGSRGIAVDPATHEVWIANRATGNVEKYEEFGPTITEPTTMTGGAETTTTTGTIHGVVNPSGVETAECYFEYGQTQALGNIVPCKEGAVHAGTSDVPVSADIGGLVKANRYWYRLFVEDVNGRVSAAGPKRLRAQSPPLIEDSAASEVNTDGARLNGVVDPNGGRTFYHFEYGTTTAYGNETSEVLMIVRQDEAAFTTQIELPESFIDPRSVSVAVADLDPNVVHHFRVVARNEQGTTFGPDVQFRTFEPDPSSDPCPNALVRQQTSASLLSDCRAYELVSAGNAGGYDVASDLVPGQEPFAGFPRADDRALYGIDSGAVPGIAGNPTTFDRDPYVATRGASGWATEYVGLPANGMAQEGPFGSPVLAADSLLSTVAFGGSGICDPCFKDGSGESTNIPLRRPDGNLVRGMAGSLNPHANAAGVVRKRFSADGTHFIFGATQKFEPTGNEGEVSIYDRNLVTDQTQVVSTLPNGNNLSGDVAQLDVSADGSRVLIGRLVETDEAGNDFYDLFMHVGPDPGTVAVADTAGGVLYNGMTADGSTVYFSTPDQLDDDADSSTDAYAASVGPNIADVNRISTGTGGTGNSDACEPPGDPDSWNAVSGDGQCGTVAFAGGAGVASGDGTFFFMSPEMLDGPSNGVAGEVNLYRVAPGDSPEFVGTIDSSAVKPPAAPASHPVLSTGFITGLSTAEGLAVDQSTGDIYVAERGGGGRIARYDSTGAAKEFPVPGGSNKIADSGIGAAGEAQIAFDSSGSPLNDSFYVRSAATTVAVYSTSGEGIGSLTGLGNVCGLAVDRSTGALFVGDAAYGGIRKFMPISGSTPVSNANYTETSIKTLGLNPCAVGVDTAGNVYATNFNSGPISVFPESEFSASPPSLGGETLNAQSLAVATNPVNDEVYVSEGNQIAQFNAAGDPRQQFGLGSIGTQSRGLAVDESSGRVYASNGGSVVAFEAEPVPYAPIDNPAVVHAVQQANALTTEDFQVTPDGEFAAFASNLALTGYPNNGESHVFRYDASSGDLDCVSCAPTGSPSTGGATLAPKGLNLTDDGRVFFTSSEGLVLRDSNGKSDAYEWSDGSVQLISTGVGPDNSRLLSVSADGKNAFFFTRDSLVPEDENGSAIKLYTAREEGGYVYDPPLKPCAASDECHGAGTEAPPPPDINTFTGEGVSESTLADARCRTLGRRAKRNSKKARQLLRRARKSSDAVRSRKLRLSAKRGAVRARKLSAKARSCRRSSGGNG